jgi:hypothetical protein
VISGTYIYPVPRSFSTSYRESGRNKVQIGKEARSVLISDAFWLVQLPLFGLYLLYLLLQFSYVNLFFGSTSIFDRQVRDNVYKCFRIYKDSGLNTPPVRAGMKALFVPKAQEL